MMSDTNPLTNPEGTPTPKVDGPVLSNHSSPRESLLGNNESLSGDAAQPADRTRRCTAEGKEYFLAENRKKRNSYCRTILKRVTQIEGLLQSGNLQEVYKIHESLSEVFQDFLRAHSRCQELLESEVDQTKETKLLEEVIVEEAVRTNATRSKL